MLLDIERRKRIHLHFCTKDACESFSFLTFQGFFLNAHKALSTWLCLWAGSMVTRLITALLSTCTGPRQPIRRRGAASQASDWSRVAAPALSQTSSVTSHQLSQPLSADPDKKIYPGQNREREKYVSSDSFQQNRLLPRNSSKCSKRL